MKKIISLLALASLFANAHFLTLLPSTDNVEDKKDAKIELDTMFIHPFDQSGMNMEKPKGIFVNSTKNSLPLTETKKFDHKAWTTSYEIKTPGVYKFFVQPEPYFEEAEDLFISHVPKVIVSSFGVQEGWDEPIGLKYEIVPLTKPFALYSGNLFQGVFLKDGKPQANISVEVELYNEAGIKAPTEMHTTQTVKTDKNGVFSFVMNQKGWWGFAGLMVENEKELNGKKYPIENGALIWIKAH
ncbi:MULTISPECIES: DUF4198 domain-containing protein [Arcobacteraceae]|uniref:Nickel uptake substrate-specific transmembrane region n=2 Tax=Arcobacteraceae TaxID=2808963 RepID=A0ABX2YC14_9BACT|nr:MULTISPECIES: DUF4198 domain-containing protein [Arcobacteraceae]OCL83408.1 Nickel uptake substrate-specific transmembrane region [Arcobacter porcinus]OCL92534.1 Nickel uptake substrate-specific transmembrane region [Arcobacter porcinus]OCL95165.1 Nickel uptake substrate-specific transmembrane region [Aliarcobacter thereius LMG 24486]QBF16845.1 hypothetical protein (DUF4198 domain) [Aliarcobacter thereius LMG 24486]TLS94126.1 DUF4198 domain-containing protein [Aliarcobacter thereius]